MLACCVNVRFVSLQAPDTFLFSYEVHAVRGGATNTNVCQSSEAHTVEISSIFSHLDLPKGTTDSGESDMYDLPQLKDVRLNLYSFLQRGPFQGCSGFASQSYAHQTFGMIGLQSVGCM